MLLTSSAMSLQGLQLYALLFERIPENSAILTTDHDGVIQSATSNIATILRVPARELCGKSVYAIIPPDTDQENYLTESVAGKTGKHVVGDPIDLVISTGLGVQGVRLQVIDAQHNMFVVTIRKRSVTLAMSADTVAVMGSSAGANDQLLPDVLAPKNEDRPLKEIGYYTIKGDLGIGQCGVVRKATHRTSGVEVAIKTLSKAKFDEIGLSWGSRELDLMRFLNHPNIVHLYDVISGDEVCYLIMEFVDGGELLSYCCEKGTLTEDVAREFFRDILGAVDYLHRKGIVHRDLKLENCLLDSNLRVKIIDFGLANFYLSGMLKTSCGSADYAAPELFASTKYYGPPVDVWAMGVMLFAMLAGVFPFEEVQATLDGDYGWPPEIGVSDSAKLLVKDMFALNPDLRLTVEQIRRNDWVNLGHKQPPARPAISIKPGNELERHTGNASLKGVKRDVWTFRLDILIQMEHTFGFAIEAVVESLLNEDINQITATYKMLVTKYPDEIKAIVSDPSTAVYSDAQRHASAKLVIQQAHKRRERGAALDLVSLRTNLRDRTQSESLDQRPAELDEMIKRRGSGTVRRGTFAVPPLESKSLSSSSSSSLSLETETASPEAASSSSSGKKERANGSKTSRDRPGIRAIFEKRFSGQKTQAKDNEYSPDFSPSVQKKPLDSDTASALSLSPPTLRSAAAAGKASKNSDPGNQDHFMDSEPRSTSPVITGGLLGSFWKQKANEKKAKRASEKTGIPTWDERAPSPTEHGQTKQHRRQSRKNGPAKRQSHRATTTIAAAATTIATIAQTRNS